MNKENEQDLIVSLSDDNFQEVPLVVYMTAFKLPAPIHQRLTLLFEKGVERIPPSKVKNPMVIFANACWNLFPNNPTWEVIYHLTRTVNDQIGFAEINAKSAENTSARFLAGKSMWHRNAFIDHFYEMEEDDLLPFQAGFYFATNVVTRMMIQPKLNILLTQLFDYDFEKHFNTKFEEVKTSQTKKRGKKQPA